MKITQIKQQKDKNRVNIYLDGEFGFGIDLENFVKLNLRVGQDLTSIQVEEINHKAQFQKSLDKLLRFATVRPRSEKEVRDWFRRKELPVSIQEKLLTKLKKFDLLDDAKFARWWVSQRQEFRPKPKRILNYELRIKGVDKEIISKILEETKVDEVELAKKLIEKYAIKWKKFDERTARQKKAEYLGRKGFGWDVIKQVLDTKIDDESHQ